MAIPEKTRRCLLRLLLSRGLILASADHRALRDLERRRHVRAVPLHNARGQALQSRAWSITTNGQAWLQGQPCVADVRQIDIEDAIASASSGDAPVCAPFPDLDAPAVTAADVSIPNGRPVETRRLKARAARGRKPEALHA